MILIEGYWKSQIESLRVGKLSIMINADKLSQSMSGIVKIIHENKQDCVENVIEFIADLCYEINYDLIVDGKQNQITRLFLRQTHFNADTYYTMQLTSYNNGYWHGSYTTIYPNDLGELRNLQLIITSDVCSHSDQLRVTDMINNSRKRKKLKEIS